MFYVSTCKGTQNTKVLHYESQAQLDMWAILKNMHQSVGALIYFCQIMKHQLFKKVEQLLF